MKKQLLSFFIILGIILVIIAPILPVVFGQTINAGANQNVITSKPPADAKIISSGHGDVKTPSQFTRNYNDVNWALTDNNIIYVWEDESTTKSQDFTWQDFAVIIAIIIVIVIIAILLARRVPRNNN